MDEDKAEKTKTSAADAEEEDRREIAQEVRNKRGEWRGREGGKQR